MSQAAEAEAEHPRFALAAFIRSAGVLSLSSVAAFLRAVVTAKILAVALGPSQVGVLSQLLNFSAFVSTVIPLGLTTGVSKMVAEAGADPRRTSRVTMTSSAISLASGLAGAIVLAPFAGRLSVVLLGTPRYGLLVVLIVASFPLYNLAGVLGYVLQGLADVRRLTVANVATSLVSLVALVPATLMYGLAGAIASVLITSVLQAVIFVAAVARAFGQRRWSFAGIALDAATARSLLHFGGVMLVSGIAMWGSLLVVRTVGIRQLGEYQNGLYQVAYGLSNQYMTVFMTWMAAYVFPKVAAETRHDRVAALLNSALRANLFIMVPGLVVATVLRDPLIRIFYSDAFLAASPLIPVQAAGDFLRIIGWSFGISLFAQGRSGGFLAAMLTQSLVWIAVVVAAMPAAGLPAIPLGYAASSLCWPLLMYPMARRWFGARIDLEGAGLMLAGLLSVLVAIAAPRPFGLLAAPLVPVLVAARRRLS